MHEGTVYYYVIMISPYISTLLALYMLMQYKNWEWLKWHYALLRINDTYQVEN